MRNFARAAMLRVLSDTRGAEIAEAAAVLPLMFLFLLGIFWFGQAFAIYGAITRAAQDGARAGATPVCATCIGVGLPATQSVNNAANAVQASLLASQLNPSLVQLPATTPNNLTCSTQVVAACQQGSNGYNFCIQTGVMLIPPTGVPGPMPACGIAVSFTYPFTFWLPFTSLNKQTIQISASGRMHLENR